MSLPVSRPSVPSILRNHLRRIRALEALVNQSLVANQTFVWPDQDAGGDNPSPTFDAGPITLLAVSFDNVAGSEGLHAVLWDDEFEEENIKWVIPGPSELGAVPFSPIRFNLGCVLAVYDNSGTLIDPTDFPMVRVCLAAKV